MKLELKHLAPYLPYELKGICSEEFAGIETVLGISKYKNTKEKYLITDFDELDIEVFKPILRPLSDLTKEIEHNGEKFVPMKMLFNEIIYEGNEDLENIFVNMDNLYFEEKGIYGYIHSQNNTDFMNLYILNKKIVETSHGSIYGGGIGSRAFNYLETTHLNERLFEWHFDVFGLIEAGLAIDINTL